MRVYFLFIYVISSIFSNSSDYFKSEIGNLKENSHPIVDTFIKEIPTLPNGDYFSYYKNKANVEQFLGLKSMEQGVDSLEIRLWFGYAFSDSAQLIIIKNEHIHWTGEYYSMLYKSKGNKLYNIESTKRSIIPKSGWSSFMQKIFFLKLLSLPDCYSITDYDIPTDGDDVIVEIASKKNYRIYLYKEPNMHKRIHSQAKYMEQVLILIEKEFGINRYKIF